ncbi:energy-coupling factor transporter transmembrane component T family protein [Pediococcus argentinicus]|nr:energy-coupling factor transporter transmembrane component T [Pediococcus argentinicus]NKZ22531.1 energy-coupling factor transporter transmembrane protein EcfT [Pediococcus argentinicus]GEP19867.1 energy-coupling factor transporter transmembrane protein EcfT [Pediococcus argentinicus]
MNKILLGRYLPGHSFIHRMDPRMKIVLSFLYIITVFFANSWLMYGILFLGALFWIVGSQIPIKYFWDGVKPIISVILLTMLIQILFGVGGHVYFKYGIITVTSQGLLNAVYLAIRFILIVLVSTVLTLSTSPLEISGAIESLLMPLKRFHFPVYELALMLSIALRFVPTLIDETERIMNAQRSRGADFSHGSLWTRIKKLIAILIPLFESAFGRADELAVAMEARGYRGGEGRSRYRVLQLQRMDWVAALIMIAFSILIILMRVWG